MRWGLAGLVAIALALLAPSAHAGVAGFDSESLEIHDRNLFDLGVTDYDDDGDLDIFTVNHLSRQSLLQNDGVGAFTESLYPAGLAQTRAFPGWEDKEDPEVTGPGLYVSRSGELRFQHVGPGRVEGFAEFMFPVRESTKGDARVTVRRIRHREPDRWRASFTLNGDSRVGLDPRRMAHPMRVHIPKPFPLEDVFVGALEVNPSKRRFTLYVRDRHGMAWADVNRDRATDVFIVRGGLKAAIGRLGGAIRDELLDGAADRFKPSKAARSLDKGNCRGRAAGAVDLNADGRLDLFTTCKAHAPRLYRRKSDGRFESMASGALDTDILRFADLDGDPALEGLGVYDGGFAVFERDRGWRRDRTIGGRHRDSQPTGLAMGDPDGDGDQDIYVAKPTGSTLLLNRKGGLVSLDPRRFGLPGRAQAAGWVDYDNNGRLDLHTVPGGLFRGRAGFTFKRAGTLASVEDPAEARVAWPDLDGDGARDAVISARPRGSNESHTVVHRAAEPDRHWLQVDLRGKAGNPQAVGARVRVRAEGRVQTQWVGQNETSPYSQGHYRTYFGLRDAEQATVIVRWTDGRTRRYGPFPADQLLTIAR